MTTFNVNDIVTYITAINEEGTFFHTDAVVKDINGDYMTLADVETGRAYTLGASPVIEGNNCAFVRMTEEEARLKSLEFSKKYIELKQSNWKDHLSSGLEPRDKFFDVDEYQRIIEGLTPSAMSRAEYLDSKK